MTTFSCAIAAQRAGEHLIGTAGHYQTYVLIECPMPWAARAFDSQPIPAALRNYIHTIKKTQSVQFLCIARGTASMRDRTTVMIYERTGSLEVLPAFTTNSTRPFTGGYRGYELDLESLDQVVPCLKAYWQQQYQPQKRSIPLGHLIHQQDLLVCTHGMRDRCCARFGQPFFREAKKLSKQGHLPNIRVWQASHIGGHRFAPTAISLPDGRYYGRLTLAALRAIASRHGSINLLSAVYRGWGILPEPLQVLEQQLLLSQGWAGLNNKVTYRLLNSLSEADSFKHSAIEAELTSQQPDGEIITHRARIIRRVEETNRARECVQDDAKPTCGNASPTVRVSYTVSDHSVVSCFEGAIAAITFS